MRLSVASNWGETNFAGNSWPQILAAQGPAAPLSSRFGMHPCQTTTPVGFAGALRWPGSMALAHRPNTSFFCAAHLHRYPEDPFWYSAGTGGYYHTWYELCYSGCMPRKFSCVSRTLVSGGHWCLLKPDEIRSGDREQSLNMSVCENILEKWPWILFHWDLRILILHTGLLWRSSVDISP